MEALLALLAGTLALAVLASPVLALMAYSRARRLEERLRRVEEQLRRARPESPASEVSSPPRAAPLPFRREPPAPEPKQDTPELAPPRPRPTARTAAPEKIQWEKWLGIRGAAVAGGVLLALAGLLLFKHAFEHGWVTPVMRLVIGACVGLGALVAGEFFQRREFRHAPAGCVGAGIVVLYATTWAAYRLYGFTPVWLALPSLAFVTAMCAGLSIRFRSQFVAVLGLMGGFASPLSLSIQAEHPIGLFGYLLLLDLGLLGLGRRMKWPLLGILGVLGTDFVLGLWMLFSGQSEHFPLLLISLGILSLLFVAAAGGVRGTQGTPLERKTWFASQASALLLPFAFAFYFVGVTEFGQSLWPLATFLAFLLLAAAWVDHRGETRWLARAVGVGAIGVFATWMIRSGAEASSPWEYTACSLGLTLLMITSDWWFARFDEKPSDGSPASSAQYLAWMPSAFALLNVLAAAMQRGGSPWPLLLAVTGQAVFLHITTRDQSGWQRVAGAFCAAFAFLMFRPLSQQGSAYATAHAVALAATVLAYFSLVLPSKWPDRGTSGLWAARASALLLVFMLPATENMMGVHLDAFPPWQAPASLAGFGVLFLGVLFFFKSNTEREDSLRWFAGCTTFLFALTLARSIDEAVVPITAALTALGLAGTWRWLPARGLAWVTGLAVGLSGAAIASDVLLAIGGQDVFPNAPQVLWNWTAYRTAVPTMGAFAVAWILSGREESAVPKAARQVVGLVATLGTFVFVNLQVLLYFETEPFLRLRLTSFPARDFTLSVTWILFSLSILGIGMQRQVSGLRQLSLAFLMLTLGKVFLHDLGEVQGLWRVGSLAGLAVSLLMVSLVYQRWVFPKRSSTRDSMSDETEEEG